MESHDAEFREGEENFFVVEDTRFNLSDPAMAVSKGLDRFKEGRLSKDGMLVLLQRAELVKAKL